MGQRVVERVPESIPDYYQPAEQKYDIPLSQQFSSSPSPDLTTTPSTFETNYEEVYTPAFQTTTPPTVDQRINKASEIETSLNEVATEEPPVDEGLFASFTSLFSSTTTESNTPDRKEEGQANHSTLSLSSSFFSSVLGYFSLIFSIHLVVTESFLSLYLIFIQCFDLSIFPSPLIFSQSQYVYLQVKGESPGLTSPWLRLQNRTNNQRSL